MTDGEKLRDLAEFFGIMDKKLIELNLPRPDAYVEEHHNAQADLRRIADKLDEYEKEVSIPQWEEVTIPQWPETDPLPQWPPPREITVIGDDGTEHHYQLSPAWEEVPDYVKRVTGTLWKGPSGRSHVYDGDKWQEVR